MATKSKGKTTTRSKAKTGRRSPKGRRTTARKNPDPNHKAQGYGQVSIWPTSRGQIRRKYVKAHYRSTRYDP